MELVHFQSALQEGFEVKQTKASRITLPLLLATAILLPGTSASEPWTHDLFGTWRNPKDSVHVEIRPCAAAACGFVVWASAKARNDVRRSTGQELVGLQLFRDMTPSGVNGWRGKVFVPDLNLTFTGFAKPIDGNELRAKGCLVGKAFCKSQTWTRVTSSAESLQNPHD